MSHCHPVEIKVLGPFRLDLTVWALRRRPHNAIDRWDESTYRRVVGGDDGGAFGMSVKQGSEASQLSVGLAGGGVDEAARRVARGAANRLLGLDLDLSDFGSMAARDPLLGPLASRMRGLRPPRFLTAFEALVNGIACQQLSLTVGIHLLNRLAADRGRPLADDPRAARSFPGPEELATAQPDELRRHGFSYAKASTIVEVARSVAGGTLDLESLDQLDDSAAMERLTDLRGIGRWTAEYVLLRGLGRLHVFPGDDVGAHNKLRRLFGIDTALDHDRVQQLVAPWHPYAGFVYFHLLLDSLASTGVVERMEPAG